MFCFILRYHKLYSCVRISAAFFSVQRVIIIDLLSKHLMICVWHVYTSTCFIITHNFMNFFYQPNRPNIWGNLSAMNVLHFSPPSSSLRFIGLFLSVERPRWVYKPVWHIPWLSVQLKSSWWWTEELSETCRISSQNKFVKLVHLVGFIIKKFVTMHGHTNVKYEYSALLIRDWLVFDPRMKC
jgi:hypothetical protein